MTEVLLLQVGERAIALRDEMYCQCPAVASGCCHDHDSDARHRMDANASFGCEAHRVDELVVRLRMVQL
jgi:hypothetical protein